MDIGTDKLSPWILYPMLFVASVVSSLVALKLLFFVFLAIYLIIRLVLPLPKIHVPMEAFVIPYYAAFVIGSILIFRYLLKLSKT